ncbi:MULTISPECIES: DUF3918 family protein [Alkalihalophilus]|jgi:hypothetical protein|uniref:DUF3918 domain-containing protein n=2 Tax=Alkalihalophilus pseudofirmus TaxID=79885 RepID=D3FVZ2_ALKPO|nr:MULTISPECIES: DUF3918 family protein [Alkalihalophilus]ADC50424.1 hypothetical protein BpOF4_11855 [Alkalihalophilus pseudofirmus OF4]MDV2883574.1 DUF3918 family protein [Alkalihalophilus pseudofirmus]MEC2072146.1 DUF3918 family protein [Alkalihalophilus marmarensis]OLS36564.1 hypothetical protein BTR22_11050 [Alkalihalophilus pseudofirmus]WEG17705.1 DUF3918 family protein [Alkalihalophilus pseudofirmus]
MRKAFTSLLAVGVGAAAYSMSSRQKKRKFDQFIQPITRLDMDKYLNKRTWNKTMKRLTKRFS